MKGFRLSLELLKKIDGFIAKIEGWELIAILGLMMVVAFLQVVLRNFFSTGLSWGDGLTRALVLWAGLVGASLAVKEGRYINVDAFSRLLKPKAKRIARLVIYFFAMVVCFCLGMAGVSFEQMEYAAGSSYSIGVQSWVIELIIPVTFFFLCLRFLIKALSIIAGEELEKQEWER